MAGTQPVKGHALTQFGSVSLFDKVFLADEVPTRVIFEETHLQSEVLKTFSGWNSSNGIRSSFLYLPLDVQALAKSPKQKMRR
jgi:hypothetical protein